VGLFLVNLLAWTAVPSAASSASLACAAGTSIVASPSPGKVGNQLSGVISLSASDAWAVGGASTPVGNPPALQTEPLIVRWNGTGWRGVHTPLVGAGVLSGIAAVSESDIWAVGHQGSNESGTPLIEHWNGTAWSVVPNLTVPSGYLLGVSVLASNDAWAVGIRLGMISTSLIEHWDGATWSVVQSPNPGVDYNEIDSVVAISPDQAWAVGFSQSNEVSSPLLARWDGSSWSLASSPRTVQPNGVLRSVAAQSADDVWAVGQTSSSDGSVVQTLIEHSDGHMWKVVSSPSPTTQSWLKGVSVVGGTVWAVGVQVDGTSTNRTLMERGQDGKIGVVASANRGTSHNSLEAIAATANGVAWAVGSDQGLTKGETLVLLACQ